MRRAMAGHDVRPSAGIAACRRGLWRIVGGSPCSHGRAVLDALLQGGGIVTRKQGPMAS